MTNTVTPARPWEACKALARATWTRARATTHPALDHAADAAAPEDALVVLLRRVSAVVGDGAVALRDGRLDPAELRALRPQVQDVGRAAARLLRAVDHVLGAADTAKVVHLRGVR